MASLLAVLQGREVWLVKLAGTDSPEEADALRGCKLLIRPTDRPPLADEDEFYAQVCFSYLQVLSLSLLDGFFNGHSELTPAQQFLPSQICSGCLQADDGSPLT
jgi:hypothetical protein